MVASRRTVEKQIALRAVAGHNAEMDVSENFAAQFNLCEGCLWLGIAGIIAWRLRRRVGSAKMDWLLPPTFVVFGISDFIEARTGAFWVPWWLLVVKTACVVVFLAVGIHHRRERVRLNAVAQQRESNPKD